MDLSQKLEIKNNEVVSTLISPRAIRYDYHSKSNSVDQYTILGTMDLHLKTFYTYSYETIDPAWIGRGLEEVRKQQVTSVNPSCYLTGFTLGTNIGNHSVSSYISSDKKSFTTSAIGSLERYIILEGIGKLWEDPFSINYTYKVF